MANTFESVFDLPKPTCCSKGDCCKGASPSTPYHRLLARAANGDEFARGFFSLMVPYASHDEARAIVPGLVERTLASARKLDDFEQDEADVVFYHCRYLQADNKCGVYEDRPQFCRDYPDSPFVVFAPGCAYESWGQACKIKYQAMKAELDALKALKDNLAQQLDAHRQSDTPADAPASQVETVWPLMYSPITSFWPSL